MMTTAMYPFKPHTFRCLGRWLAMGVWLSHSVAGVAEAGVNPAATSLNRPAEHRVWQRTPLHITLPVGVERQVRFDSPVVFEGSKAPTLTSENMSVMNNQGTLYLTARTPFEKTRVPVRVRATGQQVLLDLEGVKASQSPMLPAISVIVPPQSSQSSQGGRLQDERHRPSPLVKGSTLGNSVPTARLVRYAIQQLYAPLRLVPYHPSITRTPMGTTHSVPLVAGNRVWAMPKAAWRDDHKVVTAVLLHNTTTHTVPLHYEQLQGHWLAASFYPRHVLHPRGQLGDSTTVFLVSTMPFEQALLSLSHGLSGARL